MGWPNRFEDGLRESYYSVSECDIEKERERCIEHPFDTSNQAYRLKTDAARWSVLHFLI